MATEELMPGPARTAQAASISRVRAPETRGWIWRLWAVGDTPVPGAGGAGGRSRGVRRGGEGVPGEGVRVRVPVVVRRSAGDLIRLR